MSKAKSFLFEKILLFTITKITKTIGITGEKDRFS